MKTTKMIFVVMAIMIGSIALQGCSQEKEKQDETEKQLTDLYNKEKENLDAVASEVKLEDVQKRVKELMAEGKTLVEIRQTLIDEGVPQELLTAALKVYENQANINQVDTNTRPTITVN